LSLSSTRLRARTAAAAFLAACVAVIATALPAAAHVTISPDTAAQGGYGGFSFRVPNEREVPTTQVQVVFPTDHPVPSVSIRPLPGWQYKTQTAKLPAPVKTDDGDEITESVSTVTWTGGTIKPGEFQEFDVSMGPLPKDTGKLVFKALQTYANGEVVRWIQLGQEGQPEPENPAMVLTLSPATGGDHADTSTPVSSEQGADSKADGSDGTARLLGALGLVVGLAGAGVAVLALRRPPGQRST
jgi:uncharacterized protein YcnI